VDVADTTGMLIPFLRGRYHVGACSSGAEALDFFRRAERADLIVTNLELPDVSGVDICREARTLSTPPAVLVTTAKAERVPDALAAGCDGVLLKPFAPNLLAGRVGRLLRARAEALTLRARWQLARSQHLAERLAQLREGTNRVWPDASCPYCEQRGVTSFEFASHRRAWYACTACKKVWLAKRRE
jgi:DNA-binding response OmpR family regulator